MVTGHRDLFDWARGSGNHKVEPKFPAAALLDSKGRKVEPEVLFSPDDPEVEEHRNHLGCPCCDAKLRWTAPKDKIVGSRPRKGFFSSKDLSDHEDCDLASSDEKVRKLAINRLEFFAQSGSKILYWNIPYKHKPPKFENSSDPLREISPVIQSGVQDGDAPVTYQIDNMDDFLKLANHKSFDDPFWQSVVIYDEEHRIPWKDFVYGDNQNRFLNATFDQAAKGAEQPKIIVADIAPIQSRDIHMCPYRPGLRVAFDQDRHLYTIECEPVELNQSHDGHTFRSQIIIQTHSNEVFQSLIDGSTRDQNMVLHGIASNSPLEIKNIRSRWPERECPNNILRTFLSLSTVADIGVPQEANFELPDADLEMHLES